MQTFISILLTLAIFLVIIIIHEFGHFISAKLCNVKVNEFSIGMGPVIFKKRGEETLYSVRAFPIGGFVSMEGEDVTSLDERAFSNQSVLKRLFIISAGAIMNLILGFLVVVLITSFGGRIATKTIASVNENSVVAQSGIKSGDTILKVNGRTVFVTDDINYELSRDEDRDVSMLIKRNGEKILLPSVKYNPKKEGSLGITVESKDKNVFSVISYSAKYSVSIARLIWISIIDLFAGRASVNDLSGPVGMTNLVGQVSRVGIPDLALLFAFITINVGIFNVLPIPALDGGRLLFLLIEFIRRKPMKPEHEGFIHFIGFLLVIGLMIFVTVNDIFKLIR